MDRILGIGFVAVGVLALSVGTWSTRARVRLARRAYRKTTVTYATMPEGWHAWFLGGFSSLTMAMRSLQAGAGWILWIVSGVVMLVLGVHALFRAFVP